MRKAMLGLLMVTGCRTMESVKSDTNGGTTRIYEGSVEGTLAKVSEIMKAEGADQVEREGNAVFAHFPSNAVHDGTFAGVWVTEEAPGKVKVRCVTKNRSPHIIGTALSEKAFHDLMVKK